MRGSKVEPMFHSKIGAFLPQAGLTGPKTLKIFFFQIKFFTNGFVTIYGKKVSTKVNELERKKKGGKGGEERKEKRK